jgi:hypothetical protein
MIALTPQYTRRSPDSIWPLRGADGRTFAEIKRAPNPRNATATGAGCGGKVEA